MLVPLVGMGLGALDACAPLLSTAEIYQLARGAGFPPDVAVIMTAVAFRESSGCPTAHNVTGEDSRGLWQINVRANAGLLSRLGVSPDALYDPETNARVAAALWGGNPANLDIAWYINRPGYREAYLRFMPAAIAAAQSVEQPGVIAADGSQAAYQPDDASDVAFMIGDMPVTTTGLAIAGVSLLAVFGIAAAMRG
jgi:hypothetical protein